MCRRDHNLILHTFAFHHFAGRLKTRLSAVHSFTSSLAYALVLNDSGSHIQVQVPLLAVEYTICPKYDQPVHAKAKGRGYGMFYSIVIR